MTADRWYRHPEHGYMLRHGDAVVTALCLGMAETEADRATWERHKHRLHVNGGCGALAVEYMPADVPHNPAFRPVKVDTVPTWIRDEFRDATRE